MSVTLGSLYLTPAPCFITSYRFFASVTRCSFRTAFADALATKVPRMEWALPLAQSKKFLPCRASRKAELDNYWANKEIHSAYARVMAFVSATKLLAHARSNLPLLQLTKLRGDSWPLAKAGKDNTAVGVDVFLREWNGISNDYQTKVLWRNGLEHQTQGTQAPLSPISVIDQI